MDTFLIEERRVQPARTTLYWRITLPGGQFSGGEGAALLSLYLGDVARHFGRDSVAKVSVEVSERPLRITRGCPFGDCGWVIEADTPAEVMRLMQEHQEADHGHCDRCGYECRCSGEEN